MATKFIRLKEVADRIGWSVPHTWRVATEERFAYLNFPKPIRLGKNSTAFVEAEVGAWQEARIAERDDEGFEPKDQNPRVNAELAAETAATEAKNPAANES